MPIICGTSQDQCHGGWNQPDRWKIVDTLLGANRGRMFAEKLVLSYPVWNGTIEAGEEFVSSRFSSDYVTDAEIVDDANTRVDENNIAGFIDFRQTFGRFNFGAGLRYEHVNFDYLENGQKKRIRVRRIIIFSPLSLCRQQ